MSIFNLDQFTIIRWSRIAQMRCNYHVSLSIGSAWEGLSMRDQKVKLMESVVQSKVIITQGYCPHRQTYHPAASLPSFHTICVSQSTSAAIVPMPLFVGPEHELINGTILLKNDWIRQNFKNLDWVIWFTAWLHKQLHKQLRGHNKSKSLVASSCSCLNLWFHIY